MLQQAVAATLSWWIARIVFDHHLPLFAPIATLVALNTALGGRGTNAVRVVFGVVIGVVVGQAAFTLLGAGTTAVGVAVLCALLVALAVDGERITMAQAAVGAVISVAAGQQAGVDRVLDALLGGGVALVFSQLLFPAHPLALLRRAEAGTLTGLGRALELTARVLESDEADEAAQGPAGASGTWDEVRTVYAHLNDLGRARTDTVTLARRTLHWRRGTEPIGRELASAARLDLLGNSCLTLIRGALALDPAHRQRFAPTVRELSAVLDALASAPGSRAVRRFAIGWALNIVRNAPDAGPARTVGVWEGVRLAVEDVLVFAGADAEAAERAVRDGAEAVPVADPPRMRRARRRPLR
ncbi:FUSC family protein [Streptomyces sp. Da 82-17]|uniref:FUSC family protein n=1 Tax=Streptomyces sp. Da 82-17 TaxID=3377116 RepID=UPI0038D40E2F